MTELDRPYAPARNGNLEDAVGAYRSLRAAEAQLDKARAQHNQLMLKLPDEDIAAYYQRTQEIFDEYENAGSEDQETGDAAPQSA
jgi:hypothetical protein